MWTDLANHNVVGCNGADACGSSLTNAAGDANVNVGDSRQAAGLGYSAHPWNSDIKCMRLMASDWRVESSECGHKLTPLCAVQCGEV